MSTSKPLTREEVESRARDVLRQHKMSTIPINPVALAGSAGIIVKNAKFSEPGMVGMIAKRGDLRTILVDFDDQPFRKRFTIAHELGHHFLHLTSDGEFIDGEADLFRTHIDSQDEHKRQEIQANQFAAALLMPEDHVKKLWPDMMDVTEMSRLFNVSIEAMGYRLSTLRLI